MINYITLKFTNYYLSKESLSTETRSGFHLLV